MKVLRYILFADDITPINEIKPGIFNYNLELVGEPLKSRSDQVELDRIFVW